MKSKKNLLGPLLGMATMLGTLVLMNAQIIIAQAQYWITPATPASRGVLPAAETIPLGADHLVIPKINVDAPLVTDVATNDEDSVQNGLQRGLVHYAGTAPIGKGNSVIIGHSSNNVWAPGDYKFVFALLEKLEVGDQYYVVSGHTRYTYRVTEKRVVTPTDTSVLAATPMPQITLVTCTPVGTSLQRLVVLAEQVSPKPQPSTYTVSESHASYLPGRQ
jgi:sortase A